MATYVTLYNFTDQGLKNIKDTVKRTEAAKNATVAGLCSTNAQVRGQFCAKQRGPSHRHIRNASAFLGNFIIVKKDFCNNIGTFETCRRTPRMSVYRV